MPSLNLDINFFDHPKTKRLVRLLGKGSEVLPLKLWVYTARYFANDGLLTGISAQEIEDECRWWGVTGVMVGAMVNVGFLKKTDSGYAVHEWVEHEGHIPAFNERAKKGAKERWERARRNQPSNASSNAPTDLPTNQPLTADGGAGGGGGPGGKPRRKSAVESVKESVDTVLDNREKP